MEYALILSMTGNLFLLFALIVQRAMLHQSKAARRMYFGLFTAARADLRDLTDNGIRRDPKTGRYMKKGK